jgi:hypothetical protein
MLCGVCTPAIKKTQVHPSTDAGKRVEFEAKLHQYEQVEECQIIYVDESGFSVDAPRDRRYSFRREAMLWQQGLSRVRVNVIGAVHHFKILNVCLFECNIDAYIFPQGLSLLFNLTLSDLI